MKIKSIIQKIKKKYAENELLDEMISDLEFGEQYYTDWAIRFCSDEFDDKDLALELLELYLTSCEVSRCQVQAAAIYAKNIGDKNKSHELFNFALDKAESDGDLLNIAGYLVDIDILDGKNWAEKICKELIENKTESKYSVAEFIANILNNLQWAKEVYQQFMDEINPDISFRENLFMAKSISGDIMSFMAVDYYMNNNMGKNGVGLNKFKDKEMAKPLFYKLINMSKYVNDLKEVANNIQTIYQDEETVKSIVKRVVDALDHNPESFNSNKPNCDMYHWLKNELNMSDIADEFKIKHLSILKEEFKINKPFITSYQACYEFNKE